MIIQDSLFKYYVQKSKFKNKDQIYLKNDYDILSVQRNLKILGIFVRLHIRDKKSNYLKYLPYTWELIERRMKNPVFKKLNNLMKKNLPFKKFKKLKKYENKICNDFISWIRKKNATNYFENTKAFN